MTPLPLRRCGHATAHGGPAHPDRRALTIANLAREAGVSRSTANRAADIVARLRYQRDTAADGDLPASLRDKIRVLTVQLAEYKRREHKEITDLRSTINTAGGQRSPSDQLLPAG